MKADLVVVGGGLGGLTTATLAARQGLKVVLAERAAHLGGRATTKEMGGGLFNQGPHALYRGGPAMRVLKALGVRYSGRQPSATQLWFARDGALAPFTAGMFSLAGSPVLSASEKVEFLRVMALIQSVDTEPLQGVTLESWFAQVIHSVRLRTVMEALSRVSTYTNARDVMSAGAAIQQMRIAFRNNVLYLDGGWQTLVSGLREAASAAGVETLTSARVDGVEWGGAGVRSVALTDGRMIDASRVVLAVSPSVAASMVEHPRLAAFATDAVPAHAACLDLALRNLPSQRTTLALGLDAPTYFSVHTRYAKLGRKDVHVVHVAKYLPPGDSGLDARSALEALTDLMQPGWRNVLIEARFLPRMTVIQGIPRADHGGMSGRAPVAVPEIPGLFLAGDWVGETGLLTDAVFASAEAAAREAVAFGRRSPQNTKASEQGQMVA